MEFPQKSKNGTAFYPSDSQLGLYPKNPKTSIQKNLCTSLFIAAFFTIAKCWKHLPISKWVDQKTGTLKQWNTMQQKEGATTLHDSMDGTGEHYANWNKPGGERQILYDLTYKRNLMSKTNKWENRTIVMEIKSHLTVTRRGGRGVTRESGRV